MKTILSLVIPPFVLYYYGRKYQQSGQRKPFIPWLLGGGMVFWYLGLSWWQFDPAIQGLLQMFGASLFFTGVAFIITYSQPRDDIAAKAPPDDPQL